MLLAFRGRCPLRQYLPSKPAKYGLKILATCDSKSYYTSNLEIYAGKQPDGPYQISNSPIDVVKRLVDPIKGSNRNVVMDNWFMSIPLATELLDYFSLTCLRKYQYSLHKHAVERHTKRTLDFKIIPH